MAFGFFYENWGEIVFVTLLIVGFVLSLVAPSAVLSYMIIFVAGMMGGRLIYVRKKNGVFPYAFVAAGFLIGYVIGSRYGDRLVTVLFFGIGVWLNYYLHDQGYVKDWKIWP